MTTYYTDFDTPTTSDFTESAEFLAFETRVLDCLRRAGRELTMREIKIDMRLFDERGRVPRRIEQFLFQSLENLRSSREIEFNERLPNRTFYSFTGEGVTVIGKGGSPVYSIAPRQITVDGSVNV